MPKTCIEPNCTLNVWARNRCLQHDKIATPEKYLIKKKNVSQGLKISQSSIRKSSIKSKPRKPTGELQLFMIIYAECKGVCQITKKQIPFDVSSFMHILSKGSYPSLRLERTNILMVDKRIHDLYDNQGKEKLLRQFPEASIIYELKDELRSKYYNV